MLDHEILRCLDKLTSTEPGSEEYNDAIQSLERLLILQERTTPKKKLSRLDRLFRFLTSDPVLASGTNLTGIVLVLNHERIGIITSRAFGMIMKVR